jgi:hypothetical protein
VLERILSDYLTVSVQLKVDLPPIYTQQHRRLLQYKNDNYQLSLATLVSCFAYYFSRFVASAFLFKSEPSFALN